MFRPRRPSRAHRFTYWQVGLFFLAAGVWAVSVVSGRPRLTGGAIALLLIALVLGAIGRRLTDDGE